jgi:uncharacterized membrane protein
MVEQKTPRSGAREWEKKRDAAARAPRRSVESLPRPEVLEAYNYVVEGSAQTILEMFEREQKHRHQWEERALRIHSLSTVLGQALGFAVALSVFVSASIIGIYGNMALAAIIWIFGLALVLMTGLVWAYARTLGQRPLFARPTMRTHFRPEKQEQPAE